MTEYAHRLDLAHDRGFASRRELLEARRQWREAHPDGDRRSRLCRIVPASGIPVLAPVESRLEAWTLRDHWHALRAVAAWTPPPEGEPVGPDDGEDLRLYCGDLDDDIWLDEFEGITVAGYVLLADPGAVKPELFYLDGTVPWWQLPVEGEAAVDIGRPLRSLWERRWFASWALHDPQSFSVRYGRTA